jgi:hypothetical protein
VTDLFGHEPPTAKESLTVATGMGGHHSAAAGTTTWLTPPEVTAALGGAESFDLDPCAFPGWVTAKAGYSLPADGLARRWFGRCWLNPPYSTDEVERWLRKLGDHGCGTALVFARTDTGWWARQVRERASGLLFLEGRLHFYRPDGTRAPANAGAPSVLIAYGMGELDRLAAANDELPGMLCPLQLPRGVLIAAAPATWREAVEAIVREKRGPVTVAELYRALARHPKAKVGSWQAQIRRTLQRHFEPMGDGVWRAA